MRERLPVKSESHTGLIFYKSWAMTVLLPTAALACGRRYPLGEGDGLYGDARQLILDGDVLQIEYVTETVSPGDKLVVGEGAVLDQQCGACVVMEIVLQNLYRQKPLSFFCDPANQSFSTAGRSMGKLQAVSIRSMATKRMPEIHLRFTRIPPMVKMKLSYTKLA